MNYTIKISTILFYLLFSQVYPILHWHAEKDHGQLELRLSAHSPEQPFECHNHNGHHDHFEEHDNPHLKCNWENTFQLKTIKIKFADFPSAQINVIDDERQIQSYEPLDIAIKLPQHYLSLTISHRAPPLFS